MVELFHKVIYTNMWIYIIIYCLILFFAFNKKAENTKIIFNLLLLLLGIFLCFGYMTGSDWRVYEQLYNSLNFSNLLENVKGFEFGYPITQIIFKSLGFSFWPFFIILKIICFSITIKIFKKYSDNNYIWGLLVFFGVFSLDAYIDNPMRNLIASVIFLSSLKYIEKNKFIKYAFFVLIASSFHMSALLMIPIYFIKKIRITPKLIVLIVSITIIIAVGSQFILRQFLFDLFLGSDDFVLKRFNYNYFHESLYEDRQNLITIGFIVHYTIFALIVFKKKEFEKIKNGRLLFNLTFIYIIVYTISFGVLIFFRMRLFVLVPFCISVAYLPLLYKKLYMKVFSIIMIIIVSFFTMTSTITRSYKYIPYTSHISYIFKTKPTFYERSNYNHHNSPYRQPK